MSGHHCTHSLSYFIGPRHPQSPVDAPLASAILLPPPHYCRRAGTASSVGIKLASTFPLETVAFLATTTALAGIGTKLRLELGCGGGSFG